MAKMIQGFVTQKWELLFEADLEVSAYTLNNGIRIPLPARGKLWPRRKTNATFYRIKNRDAEIAYRVVLVPEGSDSYSKMKWLLEQGAESGLSKVGALMFGGLAGPILAGVATIFVPSEIGETFMWNTECSEGPVYGVTTGFNV